jgi:hypothetical protein
MQNKDGKTVCPNCGEESFILPVSGVGVILKHITIEPKTHTVSVRSQEIESFEENDDCGAAIVECSVCGHEMGPVANMFNKNFGE